MKNEEGNNPLKELEIDRRAVDLEKMRNILQDFARIDKESGKVIFTSDFRELSEKAKVLIYLIGKRASFELEHYEDYRASTKEIAENTNVNRSTVGVNLSRLKEDNLVVKEEKRYYVPPAAFDEIKKMVKGNE